MTEGMDDQLAKLIKSLEAATGPSRELDEAICEGMGYRPYDIGSALRGWEINTKYIGVSPNFTTSLDAALTLVPEGWRWQLRQDPHKYFGVTHRGAVHLSEMHRAFAPTPAIALCIAALKARSAQRPREAS